MPARTSNTTAHTAEQQPQPRATPSVDKGEEIKPQVAQALRNQLDKCLSTARSIKSRRLFKKLDELIVKYFPPVPNLSSAEVFVIQERVLKKFCEQCNLAVAITTSKVDILRYDPAVERGFSLDDLDVPTVLMNQNNALWGERFGVGEHGLVWVFALHCATVPVGRSFHLFYACKHPTNTWYEYRGTYRARRTGCRTWPAQTWRTLPEETKQTIMQIWCHHNENIGKIAKPPGEQTKTKRGRAKTKPEEDGPKELVVLECQSPPKAAFLQWLKEFEYTVL